MLGLEKNKKKKTVKTANNVGARAANNNARRGFTLLELIITMAIIAIASLLIVTFTTDSSSQVSEASKKAEFYNSAVALKENLRTEFAKIDKNTTFTISYTDRKLIFTDTENNSTTLLDFENYEEILTVSRYIYSDDGGENPGEASLSGKILKITFVSENSDTYTFVLTSRTGASFGEVTE